MTSAGEPSVDDPSPVVVTLVHGTWARRKGLWSREGSQIWKALTTAGAQCERFEWSGTNTHRARSKAAESLVDHLRDQRTRLPGARQVVVAHSHGGNVAVHAVWRLAPKENHEVQVVTLATPFLFATRNRSIKSALWIMTASIAFSLLIGVIAAYAVVLGIYRHEPIVGDGSTPLLIQVVLLPTVAVVQLVSGIAFTIAMASSARKLDDDWRPIERFITQIQAPFSDDRRLRIIRAADDEAGATLMAAQFFGWLSGRVIQRHRALIGYTFIAFVVTSQTPIPHAGVVLVTGLFLTIYVSVTVRYAAGIGLGWDGMMASLVADVTIEATPPGNHHVYQRPPRAAVESLDHVSKSWGSLAHSSLYDDPEVICLIVEQCLAT